jgi:uncharacterized membrane protein
MLPESTPADTQSKRSIQAISALEQRALKRRSVTEKISDYIVNQGGRAWTVIAHAVWFGLWIVWNTRGVPGGSQFDPFPFPALTTIVSLESIFLSLFILASQNRATRRADERAHLDLQVNLLAEREATKMLQLLQALCLQQGLNEAGDTELKQLLQETEPATIAHELERQLPAE